MKKHWRPLALLGTVIAGLIGFGTVLALTTDQVFASTTPNITSLTPAAGPTTGGTSVTITGSGFLNGTSSVYTACSTISPTVTVTFGGLAASSCTVDSDNTLVAVTPASSTAGAVLVQVINSNGSGGNSSSSATLTPGVNEFTYETDTTVPTISSISPNAILTGGSTVTITGSGFGSTTEVTIGGVAVTSPTIISDIELQVVTPIGLTGDEPVVVYNAIGASSPAYLTYGVPVISSITPTSGPAGGGNQVTITGSGLDNISSITFGSTTITGFTVSGESLTVTVPAGTSNGSVSVTATNGAGTSGPVTYTYSSATTTIGVSVSANPAVVGQSLSFSAQVSPAPDGGTVTIANGGQVLCGSLPVINGVATCATSLTTAGSYSIAAIYSGDANFAAATSAATAVTVNKDGTTTSVSSPSGANAIAGTPITLSVSVSVQSPGTASPTGSVTLADGGVAIPGCTSLTLSGGSTSCAVTFQSAGTHAVTATYNGDANTNSSSSSALSVNVASAISATIQGAKGAFRGTTVPVTIVCKTGPCTGTVEILSKSTVLGSVKFSGVPAGKKSLDMKLTAKGKSTLANATHKSVKVTAEIVLTTGKGETETFTVD